MNKVDIINELNLIKDRLREHACVINGIIKELSKEKKE